MSKLERATADPTRIDIEVDPTKRIMSGVAAHGYVRFSCPIISEIEPGLFQGGCDKLCADIAF